MINKESHSIIKIFFFLTISFGIIMGLIFPLFSSFFVEYKNESYVLLFHIICVVAGIFVGLTSFLIARFTIIKVIHNLYHEMSNLVTDEENTVKKIKYKSNDIIGELVKKFNLLIDKLNSVIINIKQMVKNSIKISEDLSQNSSNTSSSISQITTDINRIKKEHNNLNNNIEQSFIIIDKFNKYINDYLDRIEEQNRLVEDGFNLIEDNLNTINLLYKDTNINKQYIMKLTDYTQIGSEKMSTNIKVISKISQNIDKILKVIDIIEEISISTNILAMNASIEAAKSGKKGEGFSVIAEEIRNLSIYTSNNASDISEYLKQIVNEIQSVIFTGNESLESFNDINREVKSISAKFRIMDNNMKILKEKSTLLNSSIKDISAITNSIYDMSDELNRNSNDIKSYINKIKTSSNNINEEIINYNDRIIIINTSTKDILHFCESNNLNLYKINNEMQRLNKNLKPLDK